MNTTAVIAITLTTKENGISGTTLRKGIFPADILISCDDLQIYEPEGNTLTYIPAYSQMHNTWKRSLGVPR